MLKHSAIFLCKHHVLCNAAPFTRTKCQVHLKDIHLTILKFNEKERHEWVEKVEVWSVDIRNYTLAGTEQLI